MFLKLLINLLIFTYFLSANNIDLLWLEKQERKTSKDFYIMKFLKDENTSKEEASKALGMAKNVSNELFYEYAKRLKHDETSAVSQCMQSTTEFLLNSYDDCIIAGLSIKEVSDLNLEQLDKLTSKTSKKYKSFTKVLDILNSPLPFSRLISTDIETFYNIYLNVSDNFLFNKLNYRLPKSTLKKFSHDIRFPLLIKRIIKNSKMNLAQKSFNSLNSSTLDSDTLFYLALNFINHKNTKEAKKYLKLAFNKTTNKYEINKIKYFLYTLNEDITLLHIIVDNNIADLYTFKALELLKQEIPLASLLSFKRPLKQELSIYSKKRQVLLNSLIKHLSNFNPSLISKGKYIGLAQMEMSLLKSISKDLKEEIALTDALSVKISLKYLDFYLNSINVSIKENKDSLLLAFSYYDSLKKKDESSSFFSSLLALELIKEEKQKKFIKEVLINFIVYSKIILEKDVKLEDYLKLKETSLESL